MEANILHHGWAQAWYIHGNTNNKLFIIENENELQEVAEKVGISKKIAIPEILKDISLNDRNIVIIYVTTPASNVHYGVKKIELIATKIHINVVEISCPFSLGSASMGGQVIVLSAPKVVPEIVVKMEKLDALDEPEYEAWNYKESRQRIKELLAATPYNHKYSSNIYCSVDDGILNDEQIKQQDWFKEIDRNLQDQASKTIVSYRANQELDKKVENTYHEVQNRLMRKSYNKIDTEVLT